MTTISEVDSVRQAALDHLWMHNADWTTMAEEGGPSIMVSGDGVRVTDAEGNVWIDAHARLCISERGFTATSAIADAMLDQMQTTDILPAGHDHSSPSYGLWRS